MENITLTIKGSHSENGEVKDVELITGGLLTRTDDSYIIEYDESELSGIANTKTTLSVNGGCVRMERRGALSTDFVFEKTKQFEAQYSTPFGLLNVSVLPTEVKSDFGENSGNIDLEYVIKVGGVEAHNKLFIEYKTQ